MRFYLRNTRRLRLDSEIPVSHHRIERNLTYQHPFWSEKQLKLNETPHSVVQFDCYVSGRLKDSVFNIFVSDGLTLVEALAAYAEHHFGHGKYLHVFGELVIAENMYRWEFTYFIEFELDFDRLVVSGVILPSDPSLNVVEVGFEIIVAKFAINKLT